MNWLPSIDAALVLHEIWNVVNSIKYQAIQAADQNYG
jgi:hypothetical protein